MLYLPGGKMAAAYFSYCTWVAVFIAATWSVDAGNFGPLDPDPKCSLLFPKSYVVYRLSSSDKISIDGRLDEDVWQEVEFTDTFTDIQGPELPAPRFHTQVKMRWDNNYLYVGAYLQETDVWANVTKNNDPHMPVFDDNDFEIFVNPDGSTHNYKEIEINAIRTTFNLALSKPYMNGGSPNYDWKMPTLKTGVYIDGPLNNPLVPDKFWSVELALPLKDLAWSTKALVPPKDGDHWRINFSRVEYRVHNVDGHYEKIAEFPADNWVWSPQYAINMHIPERWGFIQFSTEKVNSTKFSYDPVMWYLYTNLLETYYAEKAFFGITDTYTENESELLEWTAFPSYVASGECADKPAISASTYSFNVSCRPHSGGPAVMGHIHDDRLLWFTPS